VHLLLNVLLLKNKKQSVNDFETAFGNTRMARSADQRRELERMVRDALAQHRNELEPVFNAFQESSSETARMLAEIRDQHERQLLNLVEGWDRSRPP
jgi:hypothetical protein